MLSTVRFWSLESNFHPSNHFEYQLLLCLGLVGVLPELVPPVKENLELWNYFLCQASHSHDSLQFPETVRGPTRGPITSKVSCPRLSRSLSILAKVRTAKIKSPTHSVLRAEGSQLNSHSTSSKLPEGTEMTRELCADGLSAISALFFFLP